MGLEGKDIDFHDSMDMRDLSFKILSLILNCKPSILKSVPCSILSTDADMTVITTCVSADRSQETCTLLQALS